MDTEQQRSDERTPAQDAPSPSPVRLQVSRAILLDLLERALVRDAVEDSEPPQDGA